MPAKALIVMGVSGAGKSTIGSLLSSRLGWDFCEGDTLHSESAVASMAAGTPLGDADRAPWLDRLAQWTFQHLDAGRSAVVAASLLKRQYRERFHDPRITFVFLTGPRDVVAARLRARRGHFMPAALLDSQLDILEPPTPDEQFARITVAQRPEAIVDEIIERLCLRA